MKRFLISKVVALCFVTSLYSIDVETFRETKKKAEAGDLQAMYNLGYCYYIGDGVLRECGCDAPTWNLLYGRTGCIIGL